MALLPGLLASYGSYHRDSRNRLTHYAGVPVIIYAVLIPLALHLDTLFGMRIRADRILVAAAVAGYLSLDIRLGLALAVLLGLLAWAAEATTTFGLCLSWIVAGAAFVLGWVLQLFGHHLEGNRPALLSNLGQMMIAPIYLVAELSFALGLRRRLRAQVEEPAARRPRGR